jgi:DNA-binding winged helix-turn-helix (wHTH) protein/tetratricopeptide (TPR) repeat protein
MHDLPARGLLRFAAFELDLATCELRRGGAAVALTVQPARLLAVLAWRAEELVTRDEIQRHLWPDGTVVEFDACINQCVRQLRHALRDSAASPRWIQTLPGRGYKLLVPAAFHAPRDAGALPASEPAPAAEEPSIAAAEAPAEVAPTPGRRRAGVYATAAIASVAAALSIAGGVRGSPAAGSTAHRPAAPTEPAPPPRLAVLPLRAAAAALEPRASAFTEELITALGERYAPRLEVIALRTSLRYAGTALAPDAFGAELGASHLVEGSLDRERIAVRLVRTSDRVQVWARTFAHSEAAPRIAADVAAALAVVLIPGADVEVLPPAAHEAYLRGRYAMRRGAPEAAVAALEEAVALAPRSAKVRGALALARWRHGQDRQRAARDAEAALALAPDHAEAHFVRAMVALYAEWDVAAAHRHFDAAIAANPAYAEAHHQLAACFSIEGRHDEAIASVQRARSLDPLAPEVVSDVGWYYYFARRFDEAAAWCDRTLRFEPAFFWAHRCSVLAQMRAGSHAAAAAAAHAHLASRGADRAALEPLRAVASTPPAERDARARAALEIYWRRVVAETSRRGGDPADLAVSRLELGDLEGALADLERALAARRSWLLPFLAVDPAFDRLRGDPRFAAIVRAVTR